MKTDVKALCGGIAVLTLCSATAVAQTDNAGVATHEQAEARETFALKAAAAGARAEECGFTGRGVLGRERRKRWGEGAKGGCGNDGTMSDQYVESRRNC